MMMMMMMMKAVLLEKESKFSRTLRSAIGSVHLPSQNPSMFSTTFHSACTNSLSAQGFQRAKNLWSINHFLAHVFVDEAALSTETRWTHVSIKRKQWIMYWKAGGQRMPSCKCHCVSWNRLVNIVSLCKFLKGQTSSIRESKHVPTVRQPFYRSLGCFLLSAARIELVNFKMQQAWNWISGSPAMSSFLMSFTPASCNERIATEQGIQRMTWHRCSPRIFSPCLEPYPFHLISEQLRLGNVRPWWF